MLCVSAAILISRAFFCCCSNCNTRNSWPKGHYGQWSSGCFSGPFEHWQRLAGGVFEIYICSWYRLDAFQLAGSRSNSSGGQNLSGRARRRHFTKFFPISEIKKGSAGLERSTSTLISRFASSAYGPLKLACLGSGRGRSLAFLW